MAASLGPLVGAIDQGTSSTRFLVSTARRSGRHRGRAAPPRPEGSQGFRAFTALHPGRGLPCPWGRAGERAAGPGCAVPAAASCLPEKRRRSARGCGIRRCPSVAFPPVPRGAVPGRVRHQRLCHCSKGLRDPAAPSRLRLQSVRLSICQAFNLSGTSPRMESNGRGPEALGK